MSAKTCEQCGQTFGPKPHDGPKKWAARRFCCVECSRASLRGKPSRNAGCHNGGPCSVDWCDRKAVARGMCKKHWTQWRRDQVAQEKPRKDTPASVDPDDEPVVILRPGHAGVKCPDCGRVYSATDDPNLAPLALANHHHYCKAKKKKSAA